MSIKADIGIILRCDKIIKKYRLKKIKVKTRRGPVDRLYCGEINGKKVAILYGRFNGIRTPSYLIDYEQNQLAFTQLGVKQIIGSFIVGAISDKPKAGDIVFPSDYVGLGNFQNNLYPEKRFKNVDMYHPFCPNLRDALMSAADKLKIVCREGVYASFTGYPRIETQAELRFYKKNKWDVIGQTLDVEATLARQAKCHYAPICSLTDDLSLRELFSTDPQKARELINKSKSEGRDKMEKIILAWLLRSSRISSKRCACDYEYGIEKDYFSSKPAI